MTPRPEAGHHAGQEYCECLTQQQTPTNEPRYVVAALHSNWKMQTAILLVYSSGHTLRLGVFQRRAQVFLRHVGARQVHHDVNACVTLRIARNFQGQIGCSPPGAPRHVDKRRVQAGHPLDAGIQIGNTSRCLGRKELERVERFAFHFIDVSYFVDKLDGRSRQRAPRVGHRGRDCDRLARRHHSARRLSSAEATSGPTQCRFIQTEVI
jgi:hypothetical protein